MTAIRAAVATEAHGAMTIADATLEPPRDDEALVRIAGVGLCHTDIAARDGAVPIPLPAVLGHEASGIVEAVGGQVIDIAPGDAVIASFAHCGQCARCRGGLPGYCVDFLPLNFACARPDGSRAIAVEGRPVGSHFFGQSSFASHALVPARQLVRVGDAGLPLAMLGPLACGLQTGAGAVMRALACPAGSSLVVFGGGPVGLAAVMAARVQGCAVVVLVEPIAARRALALEIGASHAIDPAAGDVAEALAAILAAGADFALDTTGRPDVIETGIAALATCGTLALVAGPPDPAGTASFAITPLVLAGKRIRGIVEGDVEPRRFIPELITLHARGRFPFDRLIATFPLDRIDEAVTAQARGECVKVVLLP